MIVNGETFRNYFIFSPAYSLIMWLMRSSKNFEKVVILRVWKMVFLWDGKTHFGKSPLKSCIFRHDFFFFFINMALWSLFFLKNVVCMVSGWYFDHFRGQQHTQKTFFASMSPYFNDKLSLFLTEVSFETSEENQLSHFQNGSF